MKPGRELDALVAKHVMGLIVHKDSSGIGYPVDTFSFQNSNEGGVVKEYSTDIAAAWEVVEKTELFKTYDLWQRNDGVWAIGLLADNPAELIEACTGKTAPHAICLAALKAVGVEV